AEYLRLGACFGNEWEHFEYYRLLDDAPADWTFLAAPDDEEAKPHVNPSDRSRIEADGDRLAPPNAGHPVGLAAPDGTWTVVAAGTADGEAIIYVYDTDLERDPLRSSSWPQVGYDAGRSWFVR